VGAIATRSIFFFFNGFYPLQLHNPYIPKFFFCILRYLHHGFHFFLYAVWCDLHGQGWGLPNIATGVHFITYTYTSLVSCIYSWHCGRGVWLLGSTKHSSSQIEFLLLPSLLSCLIFLPSFVSEQIGLDSVEVVSSAFCHFYQRFDWEWYRKEHGKRGAFDCPLLLLEHALCQEGLRSVLKFNFLLSKQWV